MSFFSVNYHFLDANKNFEQYDQDRSNFQRIYGHYLQSEPGLTGRVLDIGCGHGPNPTFKYIQIANRFSKVVVTRVVLVNGSHRNISKIDGRAR